MSRFVDIEAQGVGKGHAEDYWGDDDDVVEEGTNWAELERKAQRHKYRRMPYGTRPMPEAKRRRLIADSSEEEDEDGEEEKVEGVLEEEFEIQPGQPSESEDEDAVEELLNSAEEKDEPMPAASPDEENGKST